MSKEQIFIDNVWESLDAYNDSTTPEMSYVYLLEDKRNESSIEELRKRHDKFLLILAKNVSSISLSVLILYITLKLKIALAFAVYLTTHVYTVFLLTATLIGIGVGWHMYYRHTSPISAEGVQPASTSPVDPAVSDKPVGGLGTGVDSGSLSEPTLTIHPKR